MERAGSCPLQRTASTAVPRTPRSSPIKPVVLPSAASWTCASGLPGPCSGNGGGAGGGHCGAGSSSDTTEGVASVIFYALGLLFCVILLLHSYNESHKVALATRAALRDQSNIASSTSEQQQVPRVQYLEMQIQRREDEIVDLKVQLGEMLAESQVAEENMKAQDVAIRTLQRKHESERMAREKAQFALGEQSTALQQCQELSSVLDREVASCQKELDDMRRMAAGTYNRAPGRGRRSRQG